MIASNVAVARSTTAEISEGAREGDHTRPGGQGVDELGLDLRAAFDRTDRAAQDRRVVDHDVESHLGRVRVVGQFRRLVDQGGEVLHPAVGFGEPGRGPAPGRLDGCGHGFLLRS